MALRPVGQLLAESSVSLAFALVAQGITFADVFDGDYNVRDMDMRCEHEE